MFLMIQEQLAPSSDHARRFPCASYGLSVCTNAKASHVIGGAEAWKRPDLLSEVKLSRSTRMYSGLDLFIFVCLLTKVYDSMVVERR